MPRSTLDKTDPQSLLNKGHEALAPVAGADLAGEPRRSRDPADTVQTPADAVREHDATPGEAQPGAAPAGTNEAPRDTQARPRGHDDRAHARRRRTLRSLRRRRNSKNVQR